MRTKHFLSAILLAMVTVAGSFAQSYNCEGCPDLSVRPQKNLSDLTDDSGNLLKATTLTCDTLWILDVKVYVNPGKPLTVLPGTVVKAVESTGTGAAALIVTRDAKIYANGSECCPIVFTTINDPLDGSYDIRTQQQWGGIILLGRAPNTVAKGELNPENPSFTIGAQTKGIAFIEGVDPGDSRHYYGSEVELGTPFEINDNSGILKYVSIRHGGSQLGTANEINGLTLGSVGNGTTLRFIEVVSNYDDGIEFFGGTVDLKYARLLYMGDDNLDWDQGYVGRIQHVLGVYHTNITQTGAQIGQSGMEIDGDDGTAFTREWLSNPIAANITMIGSGVNRAIRAKERTKGQIYNSIFANFDEGVELATGADSLLIRHSSFYNMNTNIDGTAVVGNAADGLPYDPTGAGTNNEFGSSLLGMTTTDWSATEPWDAVPTASPTAGAVDFSTIPLSARQLAWFGNDYATSFFDQVNYQGAYEPGTEVWWSQADCDLIGGAYTQNDSFSSIVVPTDVNNDGITNTLDLNAVIGRFGKLNNE
jgi:hypothetical protein